MDAPERVDVLIVGAGVSGIDAAYRIQERCPELSYAILEGRDAIGGTWDLFRYPGIRSDSDIFTLAFPFLPWTGRDSIVEGQEIHDYLVEATRRFGIERHIRLGTRVLDADYRAATQRWMVRAQTDGQERRYEARFLFVCTGYYDYEHPHDPQFDGVEDFAGTVVHPQFWPPDLDCAGRRIAVIGSGASAVTLVPALADRGADVTMIPRTPSYVLAQPRRDPLPDALRKALPAGGVHQVMRVKNTACSGASTRRAGARRASCVGCCARARSPESVRSGSSRSTSPRRTTRGTSGCASPRTATSSRQSASVGRGSSPAPSTGSCRMACGWWTARSCRPT